MPRLNYIQTNFTAGEISPLLFGQVDYPKYYNSCSTLKNFTIDVQGGIQRRVGTRFVTSTKNDGEVRLVSFIFSREESYILEFGPSYLRFHADHGTVMSGSSPYEIVTPYDTMDEINALNFTQSADVMMIFSSDRKPYKLERRGHTNWKLVELVFTLPPLRPARYYLSATATPSGTSGTITITASTAVFLTTGDQGRLIYINEGIGIIDEVTSTTVVQVKVLQTLASSDPAASGNWYLEGTHGGRVASDGNFPYRFEWFGGISNFSALGGGNNIFRPEDVGKYLIVNDGVFEIIEYTNPNNVKFRTIVPTVGNYNTNNTQIYAPVTATMESLTGAGDYPACGAIVQNRLLLAGFDHDPLGIWGSVTGDWLNFYPGSEADDGFIFSIASNQLDRIMWLHDMNNVVAGTPSGQWVVSGKGAPLSPISIQVDGSTRVGSSALMPVNTGDTLLFVQRGDTRIRELAYNWESDSYRTPDLTILAPHITKAGLKAIAWTSEPDNLLWVCDKAGNLAAMTYCRPEQVIGWHSHDVSGEVESLASIPYGDRDEVWMVVKRTINGSSKRYLEYINSKLGTLPEDGFYVDSGLTYSGTPVSSVSGLDHLEGEEVAILADGAVHPNQTVTSGGISLDYEASVIHVGLPITSRMATIYLEAIRDQRTNILQGRRHQILEVIARLYETGYLKVATEDCPYDEVPIRKVSDPVSVPAPIYTGDIRLPVRGRMADTNRLMIECDRPLPCHILALIYIINVEM